MPSEYQRTINYGDYLQFENKLYFVDRNCDGKPILRRYYLSSNEMLQENLDILQRTINTIKINIDCFR